LSEIGLNTIISPKQANSEALLELPQLQQIKAKRVVIFKGVGGRRMLQTELKQRGAQVDGLDLYRRDSTIMTAQQAQNIIKFKPNWIQLTSEATALSLDKANQSFKLFKQHQVNLLSISNRLTEKLTQMGYVNVFTANSIANEDCLQALKNAH
jgi:uroporphyrinogen-III synthase